ncbi:hypothetical protein BDV96DRAFT_343140 [Lophiotrema nucula]|uniref:Heme peroxidase n=1 Tax=Lophiotrema nucula TaxID=690887 RepID=A0A6A5ZJX8_9PLEO|nr:hypothetical protein BDV96DRAFT_343140 [Lophiotrema nucula]
MIWRISTRTWILLACQQYGASAQTTWPASTDEFEDIMFLTQGYRARHFADAVTPCSSGHGPGRITAAEWLRTAFHDMATGSVFTGIGGLDASLVYETQSGENIGTAFVSSLTTYAPFFSSRTSMADLIALGVYAGVRACGGPAVPVRGGRVDATASGPQGVPLPQNGIGTFKNQFTRFGYNNTEMIQFVACGHTIGGVHSVNFPDVVPANQAGPDGLNSTDTTPTIFDNKIATEYIQGTTKDPLVIGPSVQAKINSDFQVFNSDGNVTMKALQSADTFASVCKNMFQKMIEIVPSGVTLTPVIKPYEVKPYDLQLTLLDGGSQLQFTGDIRIRTTQRLVSSIAQVQLVYKDRTGATVSTPISTTHSGDANGFDDTFTFFEFSTKISTDTSISSFDVVITSAGGGTETLNNNGASFRIDDTVVFQAPQSCLGASSNLTVIAAIRNGTTSPSLRVVVQNPRASPIIVPSLSTASVAMASQTAIGAYQLYSASYAFTGSQASSALFGVFAGSSSDNYKNASTLPSACKPLSSSPPTSTPSSTAFTFQGCYYDAGVPRALSGAGSVSDTMTVEQCASFCGTTYRYFGLEYGRECYCGNALDASSTTMGLSDCNMPCAGNSKETCGAASRLSYYKSNKYSPPGVAQVSGYGYLGCYSEGTAGRALSDTNTASDSMTAENCAAFCSGSTYFGLEYGRECYCGSTINAGSANQTATDCNMVCAGNSSEYCGAGNRLNVYRKNIVTSSTTPTPTPTPSALSSSVASSSSALISSSQSVNSASTVIVFSTSTTVATSTVAPSSSFSTIHSSISSSSSSAFSTASSDSVAVIPTDSSPTSTLTPTLAHSSTTSSDIPTTLVSSSSITAASSSTTSSSTATGPSLPGYTYQGCITDTVTSRTLPAKSTQNNANTWTSCASFCDGYMYFGVEYGSECYCGDRLANATSSPSSFAPESECNMACSGDSTAQCGAANRLNVFKSLTVTQAPANPVVVGYNYTGCHTDAVGARILLQNYSFDSNMTVEKCGAFCNGAKYFGTEYGGECYCGDEFANPTTLVDETECSFMCSGNKLEYCGGANRVSLWEKIEN